MKKNVIYHRAGVDLRTTRGYELLKSDITSIGKAMGLSNDQIQVGTIEDSNSMEMGEIDWYISILDKIESMDFITRKTNPKSMNVSGSDGSLVKKDVDIFLFNLSDTHKFLLSCVPITAPEGYNQKVMYRLRIRYDFIADEVHHFCQAEVATYGRIRWNVAITEFGALMSILGSTYSSSTNSPFYTSIEQESFQHTSESSSDSAETGTINILKSSSFGLYFSTLQDINDNTKNYPAIYYINSKEPEVDDTIGDNNSYFIVRCLSPCLSGVIENIPQSFFYNALHQARGTIPVLVNCTSKISNYYAPHIYVKETPHEKLFGVVQLGEKKFVAGSYLCLECGTEGDVI